MTKTSLRGLLRSKDGAFLEILDKAEEEVYEMENIVLEKNDTSLSFRVEGKAGEGKLRETMYNMASSLMQKHFEAMESFLYFPEEKKGEYLEEVESYLENLKRISLADITLGKIRLGEVVNSLGYMITRRKLREKGDSGLEKKLKEYEERKEHWIEKAGEVFEEYSSDIDKFAMKRLETFWEKEGTEISETVHADLLPYWRERPKLKKKLRKIRRITDELRTEIEEETEGKVSDYETWKEKVKYFLESSNQKWLKSTRKELEGVQGEENKVLENFLAMHTFINKKFDNLFNEIGEDLDRAEGMEEEEVKKRTEKIREPERATLKSEAPDELYT